MVTKPRPKDQNTVSLTAREHAAILAAITQGDPKAAKQALVAHLEESLNRYRALLDEPAGSEGDD